MYRILLAFVLAVSLGGCGIQVVPQPTVSSVINPADRSLTQTNKGLVISARAQDLEVAPYRMDNITSFYLTIRNKGADAVSLPLETFILVDSQGNQYRPIPPGQIQGIVSRDSQYLIPYPYVGFYYLEDFEKFSAASTFDSALPYFAENYPQDLFVRALSLEPIVPGATISGELFFLIDLALKEGVELRVYLPTTPASTPADFSFPFLIEK